jgi:hypothetical protein
MLDGAFRLRQAFFSGNGKGLSAVITGLATGLVLGLFGSGGSIIALQALPYLFAR